MAESSFEQQQQATLLLLRDELQQQLRDHADQAQPVDLDKPIGRLSRMDELQQQSMAQAALRATEQRLAQIEAALSRLQRDEYGLCVACEEEIPVLRLRARPESPFCLDCQQAREGTR